MHREGDPEGWLGRRGGSFLSLPVPSSVSLSALMPSSGRAFLSSGLTFLQALGEGRALTRFPVIQVHDGSQKQLGRAFAIIPVHKHHKGACAPCRRVLALAPEGQVPTFSEAGQEDKGPQTMNLRRSPATMVFCETWVTKISPLP